MALERRAGRLHRCGRDSGGCAGRFRFGREQRGSGPGLCQRLLWAGRNAAFALGHVHDVSNRALGSAVSVHAYSPPLSTMSYYEVDGEILRRTRSELVPPGEPPA